MVRSLAFTALLAISTVLATPFSPNQRTCGNDISDEKRAAMELDFQAKRIASDDGDLAAATLNVYFHVISEDATPGGGNIPDSQIADQISVMNKAYAGSGINWVLAKTTRTVNADWFNHVGPDESQQTAMKTALRQGGPADLNVYTVGFRSGSGAGLLGYATFPADYASNKTDDGVVMDYASLPGGAHAPFNLGQTLTHEAGHWVGLYHTFQGGCAAPGDEVSDTAPEESPAFGCPDGRDTCPGGGVDPIHNFMDYTDDACMTNFTPGQFTRLRQQIATYRGVKM